MQFPSPQPTVLNGSGGGGGPTIPPKTLLSSQKAPSLTRNAHTMSSQRAQSPQILHERTVHFTQQQPTLPPPPYHATLPSNPSPYPPTPAPAAPIELPISPDRTLLSSFGPKSSSYNENNNNNSSYFVPTKRTILPTSPYHLHINDISTTFEVEDDARGFISIEEAAAEDDGDDYDEHDERLVTTTTTTAPPVDVEGLKEGAMLKFERKGGEEVVVLKLRFGKGCERRVVLKWV